MKLTKLVLLAATAMVAATPALHAFANANAGSKLYIASASVGDTDLAQGDYEALTWIQVKAVGSHGEVGTTTNILTYDTWDTTVTQKAKGISNAGDPEIELARLPSDPGQQLLRAAALTNLNYAFKIERNDKVDSDGNPTIIYNRGLVTGPRRPMGRNEDFDLEVFTLGLQQIEIVVNPTTAGNPPVLTVNPAITGTAEVGETLNLSNGTFTGDAVITYTYQWFAGGVAIAGANANTLLLTSAQLGKVITARVHAQNAQGSAQGWTAATTAVAA